MIKRIIIIMAFLMINFNKQYNLSILINKHVKTSITDNKQYKYEEWIGVKYKWGGNDKDGVDCSGLVCKLIKCKERHSYQIWIHNRNKHKLKYFSIGHIGLMINDSIMIHSANKGVELININSKEYRWYKKFEINN